MPIIEGQKMACAPCIRGHRSTKCNHFHERVMVPVRKPGRPLSTCPCPPGKPCVCGGVRVAIPKKQKCHCPAGTADSATSSEFDPSPVDTPISPASRTSSNRVTKSGPGSKAASRRQSFAPANLERMDPNSINLISPNGNGLVGITNGVHSVAMVSPREATFGYSMGMMPMGPRDSFVPPPPQDFGGPMVYSMPPHMQTNMPPPHFPPHIQIPQQIKTENGGFVPVTYVSPVTIPVAFVDGPHPRGMPVFNGPPPPPPHNPILEPSPIPRANGTSGGGGCCGGGKKAPPVQAPPAPVPAPLPTPPQQQMPNAMPPPQPQRASSGGSGSCCSSKSSQPPQMPQMSPSAMQAPPQQGFDQRYVPQFQSPVDIKLENMHHHQPFHMPGQTTFTYPPEYGSFQMPINPTIWQQVVSRPPMQQQHETPISPSALNGNNEMMGGNTHECGCGEGCQCVGCLAHPFNTQMLQYVQNAYSPMSSHDNNGSADASANASPSANPLGLVSPVEIPNGPELPPSQRQSQSQVPRANGNESNTPPTALTPSNEGSPAVDEEQLAGMDFFFVNLPISAVCGGNLDMCPCDDSCECIGCLVHNTPFPTGDNGVFSQEN
ncbi:hypothetical protein QBC40DRAFT_79340 [Triangularia verruculosa]|uniref:Copper-fist domain-containing protein n=1 Tax=Triangularia verruculosa TaxID=2587418 RepID=A0AAN6XFS6_9PEZI|nr:hypothetical protein QBC40DRAFT_79340 [Triangularia verruculosa]